MREVLLYTASIYISIFLANHYIVARYKAQALRTLLYDQVINFLYHAGVKEERERCGRELMANLKKIRNVYFFWEIPLNYWL